MLRDGRQVAVKVQYSEAQELFHEDIHTIRSMCETFAPEQIVLLEAIEKQNKTELDYTNEAKNLNDVSKNVSQLIKGGSVCGWSGFHWLFKLLTLILRLCVWNADDSSWI